MPVAMVENTQQQPLTEELTGRLLEGVLNPATVEQATKDMKGYFGDPNLFRFLVQHLLRNPQVDVRHTAALTLKRSLLAGFKVMDPQFKQEFRQAIADRLLNEPEKLVRQGLAGLLAKVYLLSRAETRPVIEAVVGQLVSHPDEYLRVLAHVIGENIMEAGDTDSTLEASFFKVFIQGLNDPSGMVREAAITGFACLLLTAVEEERTDIAKMVAEPLLNALVHNVQQGDEPCVTSVLSIFVELAERSKALSDEDVTKTMQVVLPHVVRNDNLNVPARELGLNFVHAVAQARPKFFTDSPERIDAVLDAIVPLSCTPEPQDKHGGDPHAVDEDELEHTLHKMAVRCIDALACDLPPKHVFERVTVRIQPFLSSPDPHQKKAALIVLGILSEGCEAIMRKQLAQIVPFVLKSFEDPNPIIVSAAASALNQMATYLTPEVTTFLTDILARLLPLLKSQFPDHVKADVCTALELVVQSTGNKEIVAHLSDVMACLLPLASLDNPKIRESCIGVFGALAGAAGPQFFPHLSPTLPVVRAAITTTDPKLLTYRCNGIVAAGAFSAAITEEHINDYRENFAMEIIRAVASAEDCELRESGYNALVDIALNLKGEFAVLLPSVMPLLFKTCDPLQLETGAAGGGGGGGGTSADDADWEDADTDVDIDNESGFDEQVAALLVLESCLMHLPPPLMADYTKRIVKVIEDLQGVYHHEVRENVPRVVRALMLHEAKSFPGPQGPTRPDAKVYNDTVITWVPGVPASSPLSDRVRQLWEKLWPLLRRMLFECTEKVVIGEVCSELGEIVKHLGPGPLDTIYSSDKDRELWGAVHQLFEGRHACQKFSPALEEDEDSRALEEQLFDGVATLLAGVASALGSQFHAQMESMNPHLQRLAKHKKSLVYRCIGLGAYAEVFLEMQAGAQRFVPDILEACLQEAEQNEDIGLKRNSVFCLGVIYEVSGTQPFALAASARAQESLAKIVMQCQVRPPPPPVCVRVCQ
eukprot:GHVU01033065.1.p1 GENE.GHVU01033065.1~~GHVU01033065.1.p1  ORF type:complete len:989 (-),score=246.67 GHVU01033065.1:1183-4149(-)